MTKASCALYLVRHAIAGDRGEEWPDDAKRPLTHKGVARMREVVSGLAAHDPEIEVVLTSPLVRAKQTADVLVEGLKAAPILIVTPALAPGSTPTQVSEELAKQQKHRSIALVGHEPDLGELAAWLIGARAPLVFKKGGIARIDVSSLPPTRPGQLVWLAPPKMLRALAK